MCINSALTMGGRFLFLCDLLTFMEHCFRVNNKYRLWEDISTHQLSYSAFRRKSCLPFEAVHFTHKKDIKCPVSLKQNMEDLFVYGFTSCFECCVRCINQARILVFLHASVTPFASVIPFVYFRHVYISCIFPYVMSK